MRSWNTGTSSRRLLLPVCHAHLGNGVAGGPIAVEWRPFYSGHLQGRGVETTRSHYPDQGPLQLRDMQRLATSSGLPSRCRRRFRQWAEGCRSLLSAPEEAIEPFRVRFSRRSSGVARHFDNAVLADVLSKSDLDAASLINRAESTAVKQRLKDQTAKAASRGIFGAPTFISEDGELFWGDDRLEQAIEWVAHPRTTVLPNPTRIGPVAG